MATLNVILRQLVNSGKQYIFYLKAFTKNRWGGESVIVRPSSFLQISLKIILYRESLVPPSIPLFSEEHRVDVFGHYLY